MSHLGEQPPECYVQDTAALNASCPKPTDLHGLFLGVSGVNKPGLEQSGPETEGAKAELTQVLSVYSYMVWQIVTIFNADCDHGNRNYYIYRAAIEQPWQVISYDMDWGWGDCYMPWTPGPQKGDFGCNCDAANNHHDAGDYPLFAVFKVPMTFASFIAFALFILSVCESSEK